MEGFAVTGMSSGASYMKSYDTDDMDEAVQLWLDEQDPEDVKKYHSKSEDGVHSWWGCRIFDNQDDARKSFG